MKMESGWDLALSSDLMILYVFEDGVEVIRSCLYEGGLVREICMRELPPPTDVRPNIYISHEKGGPSGARCFSLLTLSPLFLEANQ